MNSEKEADLDPLEADIQRNIKVVERTLRRYPFTGLSLVPGRTPPKMIRYLVETIIFLGHDGLAPHLRKVAARHLGFLVPFPEERWSLLKISGIEVELGLEVERAQVVTALEYVLPWLNWHPEEVTRVTELLQEYMNIVPYVGLGAFGLMGPEEAKGRIENLRGELREILEDSGGGRLEYFFACANLLHFPPTPARE